MNFYSKNKDLEGKIKRRVIKVFSQINDLEVRKILMQRQKSSLYVKGISSYYIFKGLKRKYDENENLELSKNLEIWSTGIVILDNITDFHTIRNNKTTFLKEFGLEKNAIASSYATHLGLIGLSKYISELNSKTKDLGNLSTSKSVDGAIIMDLNFPTKTNEIIDSIAKVNGLTLALPLSISAIAGKNDKKVIYDILKYGYDTGIAFGLFEELRDLVGKHGREKASEIKSGRTPYYLARAIETDKDFNMGDVIGRDISKDEYKRLITQLKSSGAINHTSNLIKNNLEYGRKRIEWRLNPKAYEELDLLRKTTEEDLENILISIENF